MNTKELREKSIEELRGLEQEARERLFKNRFSRKVSGQKINTSLFKKDRLVIAQILTIINEKKANV